MVAKISALPIRISYRILLPLLIRRVICLSLPSYPFLQGPGSHCGSIQETGACLCLEISGSQDARCSSRMSRGHDMVDVEAKDGGDLPLAAFSLHPSEGAEDDFSGFLDGMC